MSSSPRTFATLYDLDRVARSVVFKSSVDTRALTSTAVLSYPEPDLAGDIVVPEGMDFSPHARDPRVDIEHRRHPDFGDATVGWARTTCKAPGGYYTVRPVLLECEQKAIRPLPVATTHFDPNDRLEVQAFALVERDILPAVSVEFIPDMTVAKSLGRSPIERRDAYQFNRCQVVRYTLCAKGVCPSALVAKSAYDPLRSVLSVGRIGDEPLHDTIKKALAHYLPGKSSTVTSGYVEKADMDPYGCAPAVDAPVDTPAPEEEESGATPTAQCAYDAAQMLKDCAQNIRESVGQSEHKAGKKKMLGLADKLDAEAERCMAIGDQVAADVETDGDMDAEDDEPDVEADDTEPDEDDGVMKGMKKPKRIRYLKALKRIFTLAEIKKAEEAKPAPPVVETDSPEVLAALDRELKLLRRDKRLYA